MKYRKANRILGYICAAFVVAWGIRFMHGGDVTNLLFMLWMTIVGAQCFAVSR